MAPSRRGGSTAKRQPLESQVAQIGIQHFFGRSFGGTTTPASQAGLPASLQVSRDSGTKHISECKSLGPAPTLASSEAVVHSRSSGVAENATLATACNEIALIKETNGRSSKVALTRQQQKTLRCSPGMVIHQSQDEGGDEVVWKVSPTAERLQGSIAAERASLIKGMPVFHSNKNAANLPAVQEVLARASTLETGQATCPPRRKSSPGLAGKLEQWLSKAKIESAKGNSKASKPFVIHDDKENDGGILFGEVMKIPNITKVLQSQYQPTPSASCHRPVASRSQKKKGVLKQSKSGKRRKVLLELLDQVQTVISVQEPIFKKTQTFLTNDDSLEVALDNSLSLDELTEQQVEKATDNDAICAQRAAELPDNGDSRQCLECINNADRVVLENQRDSQISLDTEGILPVNISKGDDGQGPGCVAPCDFDITPKEETEKLNHGIFQSANSKKNNASNSWRLASSQQKSSECNAGLPDPLAEIYFLVLEVADMASEKGESINSSPQKVLRLLNEQSGDERVVFLRDEWFYTVVRPGDSVNVIGDFDLDGNCIIDKGNNLLVVHPDLLISGSRVGGSFSCPRRAVLDERIKSTEFAVPALLGIMIHQLFQFGLTSGERSRFILEHEAEIIVQQHIDSLYACGENEREVLGKVKDAVPVILTWLDCHLGSSLSTWPTVDFGFKVGQQSISIPEVIDIEEMIWSPKYGLKGMIDASVRVKARKTNLTAQEHIVPLEFKTGKGTTGQAALEHRAQVILYSLLMSDRYSQKIDLGLLYYLYTNQTQGVAIQRADLVGLMMQRNDHATNLLTASSTQLLPPMLQNAHMCQGCWHLDVCSIYHKAQEGGTEESSGLGKVFTDQTGHLNEIHLEFLRHWDHLVDLEAQDLQASRSEIWRMPSWQREETGRCLSSMKVDFSTDHSIDESSKTGRFVYRFCRNIAVWNQRHSIKEEEKVHQSGSLQGRPFSSGDYVLLSTESGHVAVTGGVVIDISESSILISLSHPLRLPNNADASNQDILHNEIWRIDKDEVASFLAMMRFNLLQLFVKRNAPERGCQLIVDLKPPKFDSGGLFSQDPAAAYVRSAQDLNDDQRGAILKILSARDYALILGMPGTGKTSTIVHAVRALITRGASILLTSYTNSAVDNILLKLKLQNIDFLRIGRVEAIHPELQEHAIAGLGINSVKELNSRIHGVQVIGATCLGVTHPLLTHRRFDVCIVDEAGQITLPVCLGPLRFADTFVLVGDHYQLPPLVRNPEAREKGLAVSLFRRLSEAHPQAISALQCQYRMCSGIMKLCNALIYGDRLRCGSPEVANSRLEIISSDFSCYPIWLQKVLDSDQSVVFLNTDLLSAHETRIRNAIHNVIEASILVKVLRALLEGGVGAEQIGVISPYNSQVEHVRLLLATENMSTLEVQTIDKYQGRDKDCVLVSFVRSSNQGKCSGSLLADWHRINVAITRAKKKLILIGSQKTLSATPLLNLLLKQVEQAGGVLHLPKEPGTFIGGLRRCTVSKLSKETDNLSM